MKSQTVAASRPEPFWSGKVVRFMVDEWLAPLAFFLLALAVTSYELNATPDFEQTHIFVLVMLTLLSFLFLVNRVIRSLPRLKILLIEQRLNKEVARLLDHGVAVGARVFHGYWAGGFESDHVVMSAAGIFSVRVQLLQQADGHPANVAFDGELLYPAGSAPINEPILRAKFLANHLSKLLSERLGRFQSVRPVLLIPGWSIERASGLTVPIYVGTTQEFLALLDQLPEVLDHDEFRQVGNAMKDMLNDGIRLVGYLGRSGQLTK
jgi:hypothetical protein